LGADDAIERKIGKMLAKMSVRSKMHFFCQEYDQAAKYIPEIDRPGPFVVDGV